MGNAASKKLDDTNSSKSVILLSDSFINNFQNQSDLIFEKKSPHVILDNSIASLNKKDQPKRVDGNYIRTEYSEQFDKGNDYENLRTKIINELIAESEKYIDEQKQELNKLLKENSTNPFLNATLNKNQCFSDENKIYNCMKDMNKSTTDFVNYYTKCNKHLRTYENCIQNVKF